MTPLILAIIQAGLIPEVMAYIRQRFTQSGQLPTDAEVLARVEAMADAIILKGEAWLLAHPADPTP
jgi:hypothetical protein